MQVQRFKRGQIWWYQSSGGIGDKENVANSKTRPMLIVSNDLQNRFSNYVIAIPLTTAEKKDYPTHTKCYVNGKQSTFLAESIQTCNKDYFSYYIETADEELMKSIEDNIIIALGLKLIPDNISLVELQDNSEKEIKEDKVAEVEDKEPAKKGRRSISVEDKIRFINDYENHDVAYMLKKYNIKDKRYLQQKVYLYRKAIKGVA